MSHFLTPGFYPSFIEVLRYLEKQDTSIKQSRAFKRFVRDYGTHYISSAYMGAKVAITVFYDNYERLKFGKSKLMNCTAEYAKQNFGLQPEPEDEDDEDEDEEEVKPDRTTTQFLSLKIIRSLMFLNLLNLTDSLLLRLKCTCEMFSKFCPINVTNRLLNE